MAFGLSHVAAERYVWFVFLVHRLIIAKAEKRPESPRGSTDQKYVPSAEPQAINFSASENGQQGFQPRRTLAGVEPGAFGPSTPPRPVESCTPTVRFANRVQLHCAKSILCCSVRSRPSNTMLNSSVRRVVAAAAPQSPAASSVTSAVPRAAVAYSLPYRPAGVHQRRYSSSKPSSPDDGSRDYTSRPSVPAEESKTTGEKRKRKAKEPVPQLPSVPSTRHIKNEGMSPNLADYAA